jgi:uracil-DNA glycosylase
MLTERQRRAWDELALGPQWRRRHAPVGPADEAVAVDAPPQALDEMFAAGASATASGASATSAASATAVFNSAPAPASGLAAEPAFVSMIEADTIVRSPQEIADAAWMQVRQEVSGCRKCGLCESRHRTVFGSGPQGARWMLIGEAPGAEEDARGEPFVGQAGRLLDQMLAAIGLSREHDVFITNVLKCRPPGNRDPSPLEAATCSPYLERQIDLVKPDLILLLGRAAVQSVLKTEATLGSLRRQVHRYARPHGEIPVVCTYHPAYLLRNLTEKRKSWEDLCFAMDVAQGQQALQPALPGSH